MYPHMQGLPRKGTGANQSETYSPLLPTCTLHKAVELAQETGAYTCMASALPITEHGFPEHFAMQCEYTMNGDLLYYHQSALVARISQ